MSFRSPDPAEETVHEENRRLRRRIEELQREVARYGGTAGQKGGPAQGEVSGGAAADDNDTQRLALLRHLVDHAPLGIGFLDPDFRYIAVNRHLAAMNGVPAEQHIGRTVDEVVPFVAAPAREAFRRVMESRRPLFDQEFAGVSAKAGKLGYYSLAWFPLADPGGRVWAVGAVVTDITERKYMEVALRESESALEQRNLTAMRQLSEIEALYATVPACMALVDADLRYVRVNARMTETHGVKAQDVLGRTVPEIIPNLWPQLEPVYRHVIERRQPVHDVEVRGITAADPGVERYWLASYDPVSDGEGRFVGVSVLVQDITESRCAQEALRESAHRAQRQLAEIEAIYASAPVGLCVLDDQFRYARVNHRLAEINGVPVEAHIGKTPAEVIPEFGAEIEKTFRQVMETGEPLLDLEVTGTTRGSPRQARYWNNRWVPLKDERGRVVGVSVAVEEITGRRQVEEALRESERRYRAIGESIDYGVWVCDSAGRCTYASESFLAMLGITQQQCAEFGWAGALDPDDRERTVAAWKECVRTGGLWEVEHRFRGADGEYHPVLARGIPVRNEHGEIICWAGINLDISRMKRAEERLREGQKLESIGLLAGGIAHDFNNMLVGVIGNASLAMDLLPAAHPAIELMQEVIKTGERAAHLTRQMLAYSGKGRFLVKAVDLTDLITEMQDLVQPSIPKKISVDVNLASDLPPINADSGQVQQVFMDLVLNAAEAIGNDAGVITIRTGVQVLAGAQRDLAIGEAVPGRYVFLEVGDTGCGMDAATRSKIFDPFFSTKFTGRGLGLAAVGGIVRAHKGAIRVTSAPGAGSCFTVYLPVSEVVQPAQVIPPKRVAAGAAGTVLVVDDEEMVRELAKRTLERHGYTVLAADSGLTAIDCFRADAGDIAAVILDLSMPGMSGQEALPELRKIRADVPVIVSSGYSEAETMRLFHGQRVSGFLQKPYTSRQIAETVGAALKSESHRDS